MSVTTDPLVVLQSANVHVSGAAPNGQVTISYTGSAGSELVRTIPTDGSGNATLALVPQTAGPGTVAVTQVQTVASASTNVSGS